ncbi:protein odr-4 homolog isoform X3 [Silurus meridionalis]|uniref:protein odr-4 homolog isoform X3 n=1 Tax=Silurus meridionalis TaxID=175797 RepID=UPI001EEBEBE5|nr:protein odr-4 homolog isoform X3 [Silurus meridionalis]
MMQMGRGYIVEESVEKYLTNLSAAAGSCETGLFIGQCSAQRDFVVLAVQTPHRETEGATEGKRTPSSLDSIDVEWVAEHARQVSRMLPGGVSILGLFLIAPPEVSKEAQNTLKKFVFAVDKSLSKNKLWDLSEDDVTERITLHICSKTRKAICRTFDVKDPKCSAKPADWRYQSGISSSWPLITCNVQLDLQIPVTSENVDGSIKDQLRTWAKQIEAALCLINGKAVTDDSELLSGPKKGTKASQQQSFKAQILVSADTDASQMSSAVVHECSGSVCVRGTVHCRAYIHTNKPKTRHAAQALKRDVMNTVFSRVEMLLEDLLMSEGDLACGQQDLPRRVFAPIFGSGLSVCDYIFPDESTADVAERFKEMLGFDVSEREMDIGVEAPTCCSVLGVEDGCDEATDNVPMQSSAETVPKKEAAIQYAAGVVVAAAVALLATVTSLLYLTD